MESTVPPALRYQEHFTYWKFWHSELLIWLGQTRKRDLRYLDGTIGELKAMRSLLSGPPVDQLQSIVNELTDLEGSWGSAPEGMALSSATRSRLKQLERQIDREFHPSKMRTWIIPDGDGQVEGAKDRGKVSGVR
jgi:hypothetical protein